MKPQPLWEVSLPVTAEAEEAVAALIERICGQAPSVFIDERTARRKAAVYLPDRATAARCREEIASDSLRPDVVSSPRIISIRRLKAQDWAESWKNHFPDLSVGRSLLVQPSWSKRRPQRGQAVITLDPGLAFGTGLHPTTHFCLRQVVKYRPRHQPRAFLDVGTGSGILALGAAKLGYAPVDALDIDPVSVRVARANARRNGVRVRVRQQDLLDRSVDPAWLKFGRGESLEGYDLVCANLIYDVLLAARTRLVQSVRPHGCLVLAGILKRQFAEVIAAYVAAGLTVVSQQVEKEWISCTLLKKRASIRQPSARCRSRVR